MAIAEGIALAKDLGNLPGNHCTPTYLGEQALELGKRHGIKVEVLEQKEIEKLGMGRSWRWRAAAGSRPSSSCSSTRAARRTRLPSRSSARASPSTPAASRSSPPAEMDEMKFDMCGAASVFGAMKAIALMRLPLNVVGRRARHREHARRQRVKPGDVVTTMSGQTVEILNTDAEGRLILCDALTYVEKYKPAAVVDIATLTGAMVIALGHVATGPLQQQRPARARAPAGGRELVGPRLAHAALGRLPGRPQVELRRLPQHRLARRRLDHRGVLPVALHQGVSVGAPRHRGHRRGNPARRRAPPGAR
jgi:leucyl aminopeptidase